MWRAVQNCVNDRRGSGDSLRLPIIAMSMIGVVCSSPSANSLVTWCVSEMAAPQNDVFDDVDGGL